MDSFQIPTGYQSWFAKPLNDLQRQVAPWMLNSDKNIAICGPTASGKNTSMLLAIIRYLETRWSSLAGAGKPSILYISPKIMTCVSRYNDWKPKLEQCGLRVGILVGDDIASKNAAILAASDMVFATPDRLHSLRKGLPNGLSTIRLALIDQIHYLVEDNGRGPAMEFTVTRLKMLCRPRFVAVTSIAANVGDIGLWLDGNRNINSNSAKCFFFGQEYRAVPLRKVVEAFAFPRPISPYDFNNYLDNEHCVLKACQTHSSGGPILVKCMSKGGAEITALRLAQGLNLVPFNQADAELCRLISTVSRKDLKDLILDFSTAYHHGDLTPSDKGIIEHLFKDGKLALICSTSTLTNFVKIPAQLVVIKGTQQPPSNCELSDCGFMEILERAGRPGQDKEGCVVVLTKRQTEMRYKQDLEYGKVKIRSVMSCEEISKMFWPEIESKIVDSESMVVDWICNFFYAEPYFENQISARAKAIVRNMKLDPKWTLNNNAAFGSVVAANSNPVSLGLSVAFPVRDVQTVMELSDDSAYDNNAGQHTSAA